MRTKNKKFKSYLLIKTRTLFLSSFLFFVFAFFSISCKTFHLREKKHVLQNSVLNNTHTNSHFLLPEPKPSFSKSEPLDKNLYLQSSSDYHYVLGEALSLEGDSIQAIEEFKLTLLYDPHSFSVRLRLANEYLKEGLLIEALNQAEEAIKINPHFKEAYLFLGHLYSLMKIYEEAMKQYRNIQKLDPKDSEIPLYIVSLLIDQEKFSAAEKELKKWLKNPLNKDKANSYFYLGRLYIYKSHSIFQKSSKESKRSKNLSTLYKEKAKKALSRSLREVAYSIPAIMTLSHLYYEEGQPTEALKLLESFQEKWGPHTETAEKLSQIYIENKNYKKALNELSSLEELEPKNLNYKLQTALLHIELKNYLDAIDGLQGILRTYDSSDKVHFYLGAVYKEIKHLSLAAFHFSKVPEVSSYYPNASLHEAYLYKIMGHIDKAEKKIKQNLGKRNHLPTSYSLYASILDEKGYKGKAIQVLKKGIEKFPQNTDLIFFLGSIYDTLGEKQKTIENMRRIIALDKNHIQAMNYLAYIYAEMNLNLLTAESLARKVLQVKPNDGHYLDTLGWVLFKQERFKEAIRYLEVAFQRESNQSIIAEHLAEAYYSHHLPEKAVFMYQKALALETKKKKKNLERIQTIQSKIHSLNRSLNHPLEIKGQQTSI